jgi:hypothetical protein
MSVTRVSVARSIARSSALGWHARHRRRKLDGRINGVQKGRRIIASAIEIIGDGRRHCGPLLPRRAPRA